MIPSSLGRYQIQAELGRGAMGTVYRALDPVLERTVAIKTLNPDLPEEVVAEMKARFVREAKSAGRLNHPNIVTIYDVDVAGEVAFIAMEYLEGRSLRQLLDAGTALSFDAIADIVAQIAEALDYAGRFGIVHRDTKPANIMVSATGYAKLTDFGLAYVPSSQMTQKGSILGSPKYMSPEQVSEQPVDSRADIFSLGVVLYEMLMRRTPFERPEMTLFSLMESIVKDPVPSVSQQNPAIPAAFDAILARALAKRREDRFQRARELAEALRNLMTPAAGAQLAVEPTLTAEDPATQAALNYPSDIAVDGDGILFIADTRNNCVRMVDTNGMITTVAGQGGLPGGYGGDDGDPKQALLFRPYGLALDADENLYIADSRNNRIRVVYK